MKILPPRAYLAQGNDMTQNDLAKVQSSTCIRELSAVFKMATLSPKLDTKESRCLKDVIHQIDRKDEWFLLSANFTGKFGLIFVLTLKNAFC